MPVRPAFWAERIGVEPGNRLRLATLPGASAYDCRVALRELSRHEILQAVAEYDRLGQERFLEKYGFGMARSYRLVVDGKTYDSKAIVGAAYGFLPGRESLAAADFSGGAATVGRLLGGLDFQVTQAVSGLTAGKLIELLSTLRLYRSSADRQALYQPLALLWAVGRAHQGLARMAKWSETETRSASSSNVMGTSTAALSGRGAIPRRPVGSRRPAAGATRARQRAAALVRQQPA